MSEQPPVRILHLMTQDNQPYGSERRCCELCGVMLIGADAPRWTDDRDLFNRGSLVDTAGYVRCNGQLPWERDLGEESKTMPGKKK